MHSFHPTRYRWIIDAILHCDRPNHSLTFACDRPTASLSQNFRQSFSLCDRPFSGSDFGPCDRPPLPKCKTLSLRQGSTKRSACLHLSQKLKRLARPGRKTMRYRFGFLWGLWLMVAVQNMIHSAPRGCPAASALVFSTAPPKQRGPQHEHLHFDQQIKPVPHLRKDKRKLPHLCRQL